MSGGERTTEEQFSDEDDYASVVDVDRNDDIASICGHVDAAPTFAVVVNARRGNRELATELGMRRLARHAEETGRAVAIATRNRAVAERARQVRIPVARKPENIRWDLGGRRVLGAFGHSMALPRIGRFVQLAVILTVLVVVLALAATMAPGATVTAYPPVETLSKVVQVTASRDLQTPDYAKLMLPARQITSSEQLVVPLKVTGHAPVGSVPATASVVIKNPSTTKVTVPKGATLIAADRIHTFSLDADTEIAAGASATAGVTAMQPGTGGNVPAGSITQWLDPAYSSLPVSNAAAAAGGKDGDAPAVAEADLQSARQLAQGLAASASIKSLLARDHPHEAIFLETATATVQVGALPAAGTPMDMMLVPLTVKVTGVAVPQDALAGLAESVLAPQSAPGQFIAGTVGASEAAPANVNGGVITAVLEIHGDFARGVSAGGIRGAVAGKSKSAARSTLANRYGIQKADISLTPGWAPWLPRFRFRINVNVREATSTPSTATESANNAPTASSPNGTPAPGS